LEGGALLQDDFVKFAEGYVLFCHITTRVATDKHQDLLELKGGQGFPHIVFMDSAGNVIAEHEDERSAEAFGKTGEKAKAFLALKAKAEKGDAAAAVDYTIAQLELGQIKGGEAQAKLKGKTLSKEQQAKVDGLISTAEVREIMETVTQDKTTQEAAAKKFIERKNAGKAAPSDERLVQPYWILMMNHAEGQKDAALFEECLKALKDRFGSNPQAQGFFKVKDDVLKKLKDENKK
jgi:hypothetical protein